MLQQGVYIVGGGSFAVKLSTMLEQLGIEHEFIDEQLHSPFRERAVYRANEIPHTDRLCLVAISFPEYAQAAKNRLMAAGVASGKILLFIYESAGNVFEQMCLENRALLSELLSQGVTDFLDLEKAFYARDYERLLEEKTAKPRVGFCYIGKGSGFRRHVLDLPHRLSATCDVKTFSDQPATPADKPEGYMLMSEGAMLNNSWPEFVINPHFFECAPAAVPKLTMMHMVYDFLVYRDLVARVMAQADTHYLFMPSVPSMKLHQKICFDYGLTNNIVFIPGGYPRFDTNLTQFEAASALVGEPDAILYAPTLSAMMKAEETRYTYSIFDAPAFIQRILDTFPDKKVIFRPHPDDLSILRQGIQGRRASAFRTLLQWCEEHPRCELDAVAGDYSRTFARAAVMISDTSAIAYSYALTTGRPVIFYSVNQDMVRQTFPDISYIKDREKFGFCVDKVDDLIASLQLCLTDNWDTPERKAFRQSVVFNRGHSFEYLQQHMPNMLSGQKVEGWWYLQDHL
ncbi:CDP-glycerol glycerophosphotransferase family protein [Shewanella sp. JM162201]|uniref:CDP-glycerol glycerophosphotransferase family protein n=1 Tax=Shewanella jiangmenensis TaxID=2837387 RepID=A0ABS5V398_9GAMM|nr:CDP-glycerol glycerophosphotransferase family protein [Shewanella jiangmenensis]MBT1444927.1 CDP-glycerol glycerophosphotransferase family protein [Shewanella jiangmenensis]